MRILYKLIIICSSLLLAGCTVLQNSTTSCGGGPQVAQLKKNNCNGPQTINCGLPENCKITCDNTDKCGPNASGPFPSTVCPPKKKCGPSKKGTVCGDVELQLLEAAQSIEQSLNTLASAQKAESPPVISTAPLITPEGGMGGIVDIDWTGPVGPLVEKIAKMTDYRVKILGNEPAIPIIITLTAKCTVIAEVLQNASFQAGRRAHILVFPNNRVIEIRYLPC